MPPFVKRRNCRPAAAKSRSPSPSPVESLIRSAAYRPTVDIEDRLQRPPRGGLLTTTDRFSSARDWSSAENGTRALKHSAKLPADLVALAPSATVSRSPSFDRRCSAVQHSRHSGHPDRLTLPHRHRQGRQGFFSDQEGSTRRSAATARATKRRRRTVRHFADAISCRTPCQQRRADRYHRYCSRRRYSYSHSNFPQASSCRNRMLHNLLSLYIDG
jgi:hypothetical protein